MRQHPTARCRRSKHVWRLSALALAAASGAASGQSAPPAAAAAEPVPSTTITVTSQRREQELQKVPLAISTFRSSDLETRAVSDTLGVAAFVPNMFASNNTGLGTANVYYIRGLGNTESIATFDPPVGTYVDDIYITRQNANNFGFFDVERVEVLRGPQGTLFGRNTTGGAIRVILKRPSFKAGGYVGFGLGSFGEFSARGSYDLPLNDIAAAKVSFYSRKDEGYVSDQTTSERTNTADSFGVRAALRLRLSPDLSWDAAVDGSSDNGVALYNRLQDGSRVARTGLRKGYRFVTAAGAPLLTGDKNNFGLGNQVHSAGLTSNVRWSLSDTTSIEFITGVRHMTQKFALDFGDAPVPSGGFTIANDGNHKQISQEVKAVGELGALTWVGGVFYMKEDNRTDLGDVFNTVFSGAPPPGATLVLGDRVVTNDMKSLAIYGQGDYKLTAELTGTLGLRYTNEKKSIGFSDNRATAAAASRMDSANIAAAGIPLSQTANVSTPRVALAWQIDPATMVFGSATRGFKSGGWNARATAPANMQPFKPEYNWTTEAGWRAAFLGNRLRINGTFFDSQTKQLQTPSAFIAPSGAVSFITRNFADLSNRGLEMDLTADLTREFSLNAALGLQDATYKNLDASIITQQANCKASIAAGAASRPQCLNGIVDRDGNIAPPVRVPKRSLSLGGTYNFGITDSGTKLATSLFANYASRTSVGTAANAYAEGHTMINASVALLGRGDVWRVSVDCSNCSNKIYTQSFLAGFSYIPDPRRYGLKFNYKL